jgi:hypothetical protein
MHVAISKYDRWLSTGKYLAAAGSLKLFGAFLGSAHAHTVKVKSVAGTPDLRILTLLPSHERNLPEVDTFFL